MKGAIKKAATAVRGFSIIEIMITMAIVAGIIVGIAVLIRTNTAKTNISQTKTQIESVKQLLEEYRISNRRYPTTEEGLTAAIGNGVSEKDRNLMTVDIWGKPLNYLSPGQANPDSYDLYSSGPDGIPGTDDDIKSW